VQEPLLPEDISPFSSYYFKQKILPQLWRAHEVRSAQAALHITHCPGKCFVQFSGYGHHYVPLEIGDLEMQGKPFRGRCYGAIAKL